MGLNQQQPEFLYMYTESLREPEVTRSRYIHGVVSDEMLWHPSVHIIARVPRIDPFASFNMQIKFSLYRSYYNFLFKRYFFASNEILFPF
jgi:hypothetical protein